MESKQFQKLVEQLSDLSEVQRAALLEAVRGGKPANEAIALIEQRFAAAPACGHCGSNELRQMGRGQRLQALQVQSRGCGRTFNALTGTPLAQLHRRDAWMDYARALVDGVSLRKAAKRTKVCLDTSFRWRHRFLKAARNVQPAKVEGIVEADETFFLTSAKGSRNLVGRAPRKRGGKAKKAGLSEEQIPVLIVRDRHGATLDAKLPDLQGDTIKSFLRPVVARDALLVSDGAKVYGSFAREIGIEHRAVVAAPRRARDRWHPSHPERQRLHEPAKGLDGTLQRRRQQVSRELSGLAPFDRARGAKSQPDPPSRLRNRIGIYAKSELRHWRCSSSLQNIGGLHLLRIALAGWLCSSHF